MPQFKSFGRGGTFFKPWNIIIFGSNISVDDFPTMIAEPDGKIRLTSWDDEEQEEGGLKIGKYVLISPGVRILAAKKITIGDACMFGKGAYVTDSDWHDIYDRTKVAGTPKEVKLGNNVWIGDSAIICKGVTIGDNSIIGAGSVVTKNVPANKVYAGNPAGEVKSLEGNFISREDLYKNPKKLFNDFDLIDQDKLKSNTLLGWLKSIFLRTKED
ncbi:MAG: acyltransferase [Gammaproteobacteria bacterium]